MEIVLVRHLEVFLAVHVVLERCEHIAGMAAEEVFVLVGRSSVKVVDQDTET